MKLRRVAIPLITIVFVLVIGIICFRYQILSEYYTWRLSRSVDEPNIERYQADIVTITPHAKNEMLRVYFRESTPYKVRVAIGVAFTGMDKPFAEELFCKALSNANPKIIAASVSNLSQMKSASCYDKIFNLGNHDDSDVRQAVATYVSNFRDMKSINLLSKMAGADRDAKVRGWADYLLKRIHGQN